MSEPTYTTEASQLGWKPGEWKDKITLPVEQVFEKYVVQKDSEGDVQFVDYRAASGDVIRVFND